MVSGIKSNIDTQNITPEANANDPTIILFVFVLKKINKAPIKVEKPAIKVKIKLYKVMFILFTITLYSFS